MSSAFSPPADPLTQRAPPMHSAAQAAATAHSLHPLITRESTASLHSPAVTSRGGPMWLAHTAAALGQPRSQQQQQTQAAASASAHKPQTSAPSSAPSPAAASSSAPTPCALSSSDHNGSLVPLQPIAPHTRSTDPPVPSSFVQPQGPAGAASNDSPQPSSSSAPSVTPAPAVWDGVTCAGCGQCPLMGPRLHCIVCADIRDLCAECKSKGLHTEEHSMQRCAIPAKQQLQPVQRKSALLRANGDAASGAAMVSAASPPHASSAAAAGHFQSMADADADAKSPVARPRARLQSDSQRCDEDAGEELFEGQVPNARDDDSPSGGDDETEMDDVAAENNGAAAAAAHTAAASSAVENSEFSLPDKSTSELLRRPIQRKKSHPSYVASDKASGVRAHGTPIKLLTKPTCSTARSDDEDLDDPSSPHGESDDGDGSSSRRRGGHPRSLPDFYVDPLSGKRVDRPTRKSGDSTRDFKARYSRWHRRGAAIWTQADLEQATQQRTMQQIGQTDTQQSDAASSFSATASGARARSGRRLSAVSVVKECDQAGSDSSSPEDDDSDSGGGSDSSSGYEYIPPRPTLIESRDNLVRFEVRLAEWKARYGDRAEAGKQEEPLSRDQRRARAQHKLSAERSDEEEEDAAAAPSSRRPKLITSRVPSNAVVLPSKHAKFTKPHFYIDPLSGRRIHRPTRKAGESRADHMRRYSPWLRAGKAVWTKDELDAARAASSTAPNNASSSGDDDDDDDDSEYEGSDASQAASAPSPATRSRKHPARPRRSAASKARSNADGMGDEEEEEAEAGPALNSTLSSSAANHARSLALRRLPDSYVDGRQVMTRPVRSVGESKAAYAARYGSWRHRAVVIGAPGFAIVGPSGHSQPAASSRAAASPLAAGPSSPPQQLPPSNSPPDVTALLNQVLTRLIASESAAGGAQAAAAPLASQLQTPAHAAAAAFVHPSSPLLSSSAAEVAMRDDDESDHAGASSMPALDGSHSSAAQSSPLQRVCQSAPTGVSAASALAAPPAYVAAASAAAKSKRKANSDERSAQADGAVVMSAAAAAAASSSASPEPVSKKPRPSAIPILPPITFAPDRMQGGPPHAQPSPQSAASSSSACSVDTGSTVRLAATSSLELILAECISDPAKHAACLAAFTDGDISLADLERDFAVYFPRVGVPPLVQWGLITAGPAAKLQSIVRQRIELKQQLDNDCIEIKREARAAGK